MNPSSEQEIARDLSRLCEQIAMLKRTPRSGWAQRGVADPESVADHSFGVATLALVLAPLLAPIDQSRLLALAVVHDLAEALLTDLPLSAQQLLGREAKLQAERRGAEAMLAHLPGGADLIALWGEYTAGISREARLVKALDRIEMLAQALAYERAGSRGLAEFWRSADQGWDEFPLLAALAAELLAQRAAL